MQFQLGKRKASEDPIDPEEQDLHKDTYCPSSPELDADEELQVLYFNTNSQQVQSLVSEFAQDLKIRVVCQLVKDNELEQQLANSKNKNKLFIEYVPPSWLEDMYLKRFGSDESDVERASHELQEILESIDGELTRGKIVSGLISIGYVKQNMFEDMDQTLDEVIQSIGPSKVDNITSQGE
ncbi:hypothetical protein EV182_002724, partial [Spiromyces aspiralis]